MIKTLSITAFALGMFVNLAPVQAAEDISKMIVEAVTDKKEGAKEQLVKAALEGVPGYMKPLAKPAIELMIDQAETKALGEACAAAPAPVCNKSKTFAQVVKGLCANNLDKIPKCAAAA